MTPESDSTKIDLLAVLVAQGRSIRSAAKAVGVSESTARRWTRKPAFRARVEKIREEVVGRVVGMLSRSACNAVATLDKLLKETNDPSIRLKAATSILEVLPKYRDLTSIEKQIADLRRQLEPSSN